MTMIASTALVYIPPLPFMMTIGRGFIVLMAIDAFKLGIAGRIRMTISARIPSSGTMG
jgi:hypothetical protein